MKFLRQIKVIAVKDLRAELRTKEAINASLAFAVTFVFFWFVILYVLYKRNIVLKV